MDQELLELELFRVSFVNILSFAVEFVCFKSMDSKYEQNIGDRFY